MADKKGLFVVLEGTDGSGTTTQLPRLTAYIKEFSKYHSVLETREPWKSEEIKRKLAQDENAFSDGLEMSKLYVQDRAEHCRRLITPCLNEGVFVLSDRYTMSTLAYQWAQGIELGSLLKMHSDQKILPPDITFFIDVPPEIADERIGKRGATREKFEKDEKFIREVIEYYRKLPRLYYLRDYLGAVIVINGNQSKDKVTEEIKRRFKPIYEAWSQQQNP